MNYKIYFEYLSKPIGNIRANLSISLLDELVCVRGITLCENNDGKLYIDLPKWTIRENINRLIIGPTEKFTQELYCNIVDTYKNGLHIFENESDNNEDINYVINTSLAEKNDNGIMGYANIVIDDSFRINGFSIVECSSDIKLLPPQSPLSYTESAPFFFIESELKQNILSNCISMLEEQQEKERTSKQTKSLKNMLEESRIELSSIEDFIKISYEKAKKAETEEDEKNYIEALGLATYSVFEVKEKIEQLEKKIKLAEKNKSKGIGR